MSADEWLVGGPWGALGPAARAAYGRALEAMEVEGRIWFPRLRWVEVPVLGRWLYRRWRNDRGEAAFVHLDVRHLGTSPGRMLASQLERVAWGVALVEGDHPDLPALARHYRVRVLSATEEVLPWEESDGARVAAWDKLHDVACDPALAGVRTALLASCESAQAIVLLGGSPAERIGLVRWAHAAIGAAVPLLAVGESPEGAGWRVAEGVDTFGPAAMARLDPELASRAPRVARRYAGLAAARPDVDGLEALVGEDGSLVAALHQAVEVAREVAQHPPGTPVLLRGERGTGKRRLARLLHKLSRRGPWVELHLGEEGRGPLAPRLFGTVSRSYRGAVDRPGLLEEAAGGTLFLQDVDKLTEEEQAVLLGALREPVARRLNAGREGYPVDVWFVSAAATPLAALERAGRFRDDLHQRLAAQTLTLPPLRERLLDLPALATDLLREEAGRPVELGAAAIEDLVERRWPGNTSELRHVLRRAWARAGGGALLEEHQLPRPPLRHPLLLTAAAAAALPSFAFPPVRLEVPARVEQASSLRQALQSALSPRAVAEDALEWLCGRAWEGGLAELEGELAFIAAEPPGPVTLALLRRRLRPAPLVRPHTPMIFVLDPVQGKDGGVEGVDVRYDADAVLVGRSPNRRFPGWAVADLASFQNPIRARLEWALERCGGCPPVTLWRSDAEVSRAHFLVQRGPGGLRVWRLPATTTEIAVLALETDGATPLVLEPGQCAELGRAARIDVRPRPEPAGPAVRFFVCLGQDVRDDLDELLNQVRLPVAAGEGYGPPTLPDGEPLASRPRTWVLNEGEIAVFAGALRAYIEGGALGFPRFLMAAMAAQTEAPLLAAYFALPDPNFVNQYAQRLVENLNNAALQEALREVVLSAPAARARTLPAWLTRLGGLDR